MGRLRSIVTVLVTQGFATIGQLGFTILTTRWLAPDDRGTLILFMSVGNVVAMLAAGGFSVAGRRHLAVEDSDAAASLFVRSQTLAMFVTIGSAVVFGVPLLALVGDTRSSALLALLPVYTAAHCSQMLTNAALYARGKYSAAVVATAAYSLLQVAFLLVLRVSDAVTLEWSATIYCLATVLLALGLRIRARQTVGMPVGAWPDRAAFRAYRTSFRDLPGSLNTSMIQSLERLSIGTVSNTSVVTFYVAGAAIRLPLQMGANAVAQVTFRDAARDAHRWGRRCAMTTGAATVLAVPLILVSPQLVPLVFGADFTAAVVVAQLAVAGAVLSCSYNVVIADLQGRGARRQINLLTAISLISTVALASVLAFTLGAFGAGLALLITGAVKSGAAIVVRRRYAPSGPSRDHQD